MLMALHMHAHVHVLALSNLESMLRARDERRYALN